MEEKWLGHLINRCLATRAGFTIAMGEFEAAIAAHELVLFFGGDHGSALSAADEPCKCKIKTRLRPRIAVPAEEHLHTVVFRFGNHGLVFTLIPLATLSGIFKTAEIERLGEDLIDSTPAEGLAAHFTGLPGTEAPFVVGDFEDPRRSIETGQHQ